MLKTLRNSLRARILLALLVPILAVAVFLEVFLSSVMGDLAARTRDYSRVTAEMIAITLGPAVEFEDQVLLAEALDDALDLDDVVYLAVRSADGAPIMERGARPQGEAAGDGFLVTAPLPGGGGAGRATVDVGFTLAKLDAQHHKQERALLAGAGLITVFGLFVLFLINRTVVRPIGEVVTTVRTVAGGDLDVAPLTVGGETEVGQLASAFNAMISSLREASAASTYEQWRKTGLAELAERMRGHQSVGELCHKVVTFVAKYLECQVGAFYLFDDATDTLTRQGTYAYARAQAVSGTFALGEGLVGQCAKDRERTVITGIPAGYIKVTSGLGRAAPKSLLLSPVCRDGQLLGVIELGKGKDFSQTDFDFLDTVASGVAAALGAAQSRAHVDTLLEETQRQSATLREQQEQLEQANAELEEQADALRDSQTHLEGSNRVLEERTVALERQQQEIAHQNLQLERAKQELQAEADALEQSSRFKSEFLANMSHELRTPLNSLLILSQSLSKNSEGNLTEEQVQSASIIHNGGQELLALINDILDLSKVEAGMLEVHPEPTALSHLADAMRIQFRPLAENKGVALAVEVEDGVPKTIRTDRQRVEQILRNFLSNALKFTEEGSVTLTIAPVEDGVALSVTDTGLGIPEDRQAAIFEAFQQAESTTSKNFGGTGLGLTISRQLAGLLGGSISLESTPGEGSTFTLTLPRVASQPQPESQPKPKPAAKAPITAPPAPRPAPARTNGAAPTPAPGLPATTGVQLIPQVVPDDRHAVRPGDRSVVIIEDDPVFGGILRDLARERDYKAVVGGSGRCGILLVEEIQPTAVILDLGLPDMHGSVVLAQLKDNIETRHIPVHVVSGAERHKALLELGAIGQLVKPASAEALEAAFERIEQLARTEVKRVLALAADESAVAEVRALLAGPGVELVSAASPAEVFERLEEGAIQCLIVVGTEAAATFRAHIEENGTPASLPPMVHYGVEGGGGAPGNGSDEGPVVKRADTVERLVDEVSLFLHSVESDLPEDQQRVVRMLHDPERTLRGRRVLLVDDDMRNTFALAKVLRDQGLDVVMADNGQTALDRIDQDPTIELVLMDIMMPVMDGYEAMREIRKRPQCAETPLIALTAKSQPEDREEALASGANDFLTKPVDTDKLASLMRVWLFARPRPKPAAREVEARA